MRTIMSLTYAAHVMAFAAHSANIDADIAFWELLKAKGEELKTQDFNHGMEQHLSSAIPHLPSLATPLAAC